MGTEIVLNQNDLAGMWQMSVRQVPEDRRLVDGGAAIGDIDMPPALKRREQHEEIREPLINQVESGAYGVRSKVSNNFADVYCA